MKKVLTIAGSDSSGGAGIQADLKTFQEFGVYGMSSLTVIVAMNPHDNWNHQVFPIGLDTVRAQIETVIAGIGVDALKTGMLPTPEIMELVAHTIKMHNLKNIVIDPVMVCKGTGEPVNPESAECYLKTLIPLSSVVTPNIFEASALSGVHIESIADMKEAAKIIRQSCPGFVVIKGGKGVRDAGAVDVLYDGKTFDVLESEKINTTHTHGAGCTFSAAITAKLAGGADVRDAVIEAKRFVTEGIRRSFELNQFVGALDLRLSNKA